MFFRLFEKFRAKRKAKAAGLNRSRLMSVKVVLPLPEWCMWLTTETLACVHDYCWRNNLNPEVFNDYSKKELISIGGRLAAREIVEARGYENPAEPEPDAAGEEERGKEARSA